MKINSVTNISGPGTDSSIKADTIKDTQFKDMLENAKKTGDDEKLKEASQSFEAYFINLMLKEMRKTVVDSGYIEKSNARETFEGMHDEELSNTLAKNGGFGLADMIYKQLSGIPAPEKSVQEKEQEATKQVEGVDPTEADPNVVTAQANKKEEE